MKASAEKSSSTVSRTTASRPFFAKAGGGDFFAPVNRAAVPAVQAKMTVGKTGDKFEREADRMADKVMRMPTPASSAKEEKIQRKADERLQKAAKSEEKIQKKEKQEEKIQKAPAGDKMADKVMRMPTPASSAKEEKIQRKTDERLQKAAKPEEKIQKKEKQEEKIQKAPAGDEKLRRKGEGTPIVTPNVQAAIRSRTAGGGQLLSADVRRDMEGRFNADFSQVRVHNDAEAAGLSNQLSARAFTHRNHIFFSRNQYQPGTSGGKQLLAHELTHTIQQGHAVQRSPQVSTTVTQRHSQKEPLQRQEDAPWYSQVGEAIGSVVEFGENVGWRLLNQFAPELVPIIRQGPVEWLKEKISNAVESVFNTLMAPVRSLTGIASSLTSHFSNLIAWIRDAGARIAKGDCSAVTEAAEKIQQVFEGLAAPIIDKIKHLADKAKNFFNGLWDRFGAPVWQFLQRIGGVVWENIQRFGRWVWEKTAPIRSTLNRAWIWIKNKLGIGEGVEGQDGILQWVQRKAQNVWDEHVKPFYERYRKPILVMAGVLVMLSPAGPVIAIGAAIGGLAAGIRWIRQNLRNRQAIIQQRGMLQGAIIPGVFSAIGAVSKFLINKAQFIASKLTTVVGGLNQALGAIAGSILRFAVSIMQWLVDRFQELVTWAVQKLMQLVDIAISALERLRVYLQPIFKFLGEVVGVVKDIMRLPMLWAGYLWNAIPACIRNAFIDFFIPLILRQIAFFQELASSPEAWQQTKGEVMQLVRNVFQTFDLIGAIRSAFRLVVRALAIPVELLGQLLDKAAAAWDAVLAAPLRFIENALKSILKGMGLFMGNILSHLWFGVQGWLVNSINKSGKKSAEKTKTRAVAISPPSSWTPSAIFGFALDVLGISVDHVIDLIDSRIPGAGPKLKKAKRFLTGAVEWIGIALEKGPHGLWEHLKESLSNLGTMVLEAAVGWVMEKIIAKVSARIAALAASAGLSSVLEAVVAVYSAIKTAIEYMPMILGILIKAFDTVVQIAAGVIAPAAELVESGLRMAMPVVIGFLANYAGLGGVGGRIVEIIQDVRKKIDEAILKLIDRVLDAIRSLLKKIQKGVQALREWWKIKKGFTGADNRPHTLILDRRGNQPAVTIRSKEKSLVNIISEQPEPKKTQLRGKYEKVVTLAKGSEEDLQQHQERHQEVQSLVDGIIVLLRSPLPVRPTMVTSSTKSDGRAHRVIADPLTNMAGNTTGSSSGGIQFHEQISAIVQPRTSRKGKKSFSMFSSTHLLADKLHGPKENWNLANAGKSINSQMNRPEIDAEKWKDAGAELRYATTIEYHDESSPQMDRKILESSSENEKRSWLKSFVARRYHVEISIVKQPSSMEPNSLPNLRGGSFDDGPNFLSTIELIDGVPPESRETLVLKAAKDTAATTGKIASIDKLKSTIEAEYGIKIGKRQIFEMLKTLSENKSLVRNEGEKSYYLP